MKINKLGLNYTHDKYFCLKRPNGSGDYLFLFVKTPAVFYLNGVETFADKDSVIIYNFQSSQHYGAYECTYINDFIHFNMDNDLYFFDSLGIPFDSIIKLTNPKEISKMLENISLEYFSNNTKKSSSIDLLIKLLFTKLSEQIKDEGLGKQYNRHYYELLALRSKIYSTPQLKWSVAELSKQVNLSPSYFQEVYKQTFHVTCIADVITSKIEFAKYNLSKTNYAIKEIAELCGYENDVHFMRQFKKFVGMTASNYRMKCK
ncbi:helix-turn-helix domain-containing protein [Inconstantimicrobium mannanitabidum]|uniref:Uncharacterized protein n=1 Tax=Inconstantimicrobium mannanitabidum TaxID=1604901 RepID=A0ACB5RH27_9CLOT|nr:AraC family transcriptional regulator [Clostridium sp. TW13]GKX68374.1 hypothetical protein rsdtw13_36320 [Clostridium sp. TW13]